jgi:hypothetical protein
LATIECADDVAFELEILIPVPPDKTLILLFSMIFRPEEDDKMIPEL